MKVTQLKEEQRKGNIRCHGLNKDPATSASYLSELIWRTLSSKLVTRKECKGGDKQNKHIIGSLPDELKLITSWWLFFLILLKLLLEVRPSGKRNWLLTQLTTGAPLCARPIFFSFILYYFQFDRSCIHAFIQWTSAKYPLHVQHCVKIYIQLFSRNYWSQLSNFRFY